MTEAWMHTLRSADGTTIAFEVAGEGKPLILVGGAFCDRKARASGSPLAGRLAPFFRVYSYDRRGRGDSTDTAPYALERELEDLAGLIEHAGGAASLYGISSGGLLVLEAAVRGLAVEKLALFEAPLLLETSRRPTEKLADTLAELASAGRRSEAAELFLARVVGLPELAIAGMKRAPMWRGLEALAHTLSHDVRLAAAAPAWLARATAVSAPTLVLAGGASPPWMQDGARELAKALPNGRLQTLEGQTHDVDPALLAAALAELHRG
jgi:pimeloyl-ACP methyl ester carboxylesterase